jgi:catechol 2,3-dioxygenase-like lactoylglutathione lyase family enzyme
MGLRFLEHILILSDEPEATRDWWCEALGFRLGDHPDFGFPVYWLYIGDRDVVHIAKTRQSEHQDSYLAAPDAHTGQVRGPSSGHSGGTGRLDHVCFNCEGIEESVARLQAAKVSFSERQAHGQGLYQLFFYEPINRIKIELNFPAEEARRAGRKPSMTAQGAAATNEESR